MYQDTIILMVYLERYSKFQKDLEAIKFKRRRPLPERIRTETKDYMQRYKKEISKGSHLAKIGETIDEISQIFYLNIENAPIIGKRCIGLFKVLNFPGDFDRFLHI